MRHRNHRRWTPLLIVGLLVAACGGSTASTTVPQAPTDAGGGPVATPGANPPGGEPTANTPPSGDENRATVTIGDRTYVFDATADIVGRCRPDFGGAFWVAGAEVDDPTIVLNMLLIPDDAAYQEETSTITVNAHDAEQHEWRADEDGGEGVEAGESRVTSFEINGNTVSGTASFVDSYAAGHPAAEGTFTATCPAK